MYELRLIALSATEPNVCSARLISFEVRTARNFQVSSDAWRPEFDVVALCTLGTYIARAELNDSIVEAKGLKDALGISNKAFKLIVTVFWLRELDHLDLIELVNAKHAPGVFSSRTRFSPEASAVCSEFDREVAAVQNFISINIRNGDFRGWNEIEIIVNLLQILFEFRKISGSDETRSIH